MRLSLFLLLVLLTKSSSAFYNGLSDELRFIYQEMGALRDENDKQNMEIANLKETVQLQNKTIIQHETAIKELMIADDHKMIENNRPASSAALARRKKPARLLPSSILRGKKRNGTDLENRNIFLGPPTNCSDLTRLGYTLNGFYMIQRPTTDEKLSHITTLDAVYCTFKQEGVFDPFLVEKPVFPPPFSTFFSSPMFLPGDDVYFRFTATRNTKYHSGVLTFDPSTFNKGNGFDGKTGYFKAPMFGIYHFLYELTYVGGVGRGNRSSVDLYMNDGIVVNPFSSISILHGFENKISLQVTLHLKMFDSVCLKATIKSNIKVVSNDPDHPFSETVMGYLLKSTVL